MALVTSSFRPARRPVAARRLLAAAVAGLLLSLPPAAVFAQREGVQVGGRSPISAFAPSSGEIEAQSAQEYHQLLQKAQAKHQLALPSHPQLVRLNYIAQRLRQFAPMWNPRAAQWQWEVNLIGSDQVNAFCMPGGKIVVYWGLLDKLKLTDAELAMVMGHEMTHALREHAREQMGKQTVTGGVIALGTQLLGLGQFGQQLAGIGGQLLSLKFSRNDETEADLIGLELAARAGYDPHAAISLWTKMDNLANNGAPPELLSDHPSNGDRVAKLQANIPRVMDLYEQAPKPDCSFPAPGDKQVAACAIARFRAAREAARAPLKASPDGPQLP